jgi:hypothetical protein
MDEKGIFVGKSQLCVGFLNTLYVKKEGFMFMLKQPPDFTKVKELFIIYRCFKFKVRSVKYRLLTQGEPWQHTRGDESL